MKTRCSLGLRVGEGSEEAWGVRNALSKALKGLGQKASRASCSFGALNLTSVCVHFSDSARGLLGFGTSPTGRTTSR